MLLAVLDNRAGLRLSASDVYLNVAGGLRVNEPAADLAVAAALASSASDTPTNPGQVFFGEVGLSGEVRQVAQAETRLKEAAKLGFASACLPRPSGRARLPVPAGLLAQRDRPRDRPPGPRVRQARMTAMTGTQLWQRAALRAALAATALGSRPIRSGAAAMDPVMGALLRWIRRMPPPSGPVQHMRADYERAAALTGLRRLRHVAAEPVDIPANPALPARRYTPPGPLGGTLLYFHGGGFALGSLDTHDRLCRVLADRCRLQVVSVGYRLAPEQRLPGRG